MKWEDFQKERERLRAKGLTDLSELNLYKSLSQHFGPIAPSTHAEAPYRCHLAERYLEHLGLSQTLKPRTVVSHGVRRSLSALFRLLAKRNANVGIPSDVYPVYLQLAGDAGVRVTTWSARVGLPSDETLATLDALLICEPLKPWGTAQDLARMTEWARERMLIVDSAYATPPTAPILKLMHDEAAVLLVSLSKGWLIPDHAGLAIVPTRFQQEAREAFASLPKEEHRLRIGYAALTEHADRAARVGHMLTALGTTLEAFTARHPELEASKCTGYLATTPRSFAQLLELGILGVPATVFGGTTGCVLSSLPVPAPPG